MIYAPVCGWAILYPIPKVVAALDRLFTCPQLRVTIVPTNNGRLIVYNEVRRMIACINTRTRTVSPSVP